MSAGLSKRGKVNVETNHPSVNYSEVPCDTLTFLQSNGTVASKTHTPGGVTAYEASAGPFSVVRVAVESPQQLLATLQVCPANTFLVRGAPMPPDAVSIPYRRSKQHGVEPPTLAPEAHAVLPVDFDGSDPTVDGSDLAACAAHARASLPPAFHSAGCWAQATSSAGVKPGARVRLWFWCSRAVSDAEAKAWLEHSGADLAIYRPAQPIYVAPPSFQSVADPFAGRSRWCVLGGGLVPVPSDLHARAVDTHASIVRSSEPRDLMPADLAYADGALMAWEHDCNTRDTTPGRAHREWYNHSVFELGTRAWTLPAIDWPARIEAGIRRWKSRQVFAGQQDPVSVDELLIRAMEAFRDGTQQPWRPVAAAATTAQSAQPAGQTAAVLAVTQNAPRLPPEALEYTEAGFALRFAIIYRSRAIFVPGHGWHRYDGKRWILSPKRPTDLIAEMLHEIEHAIALDPAVDEPEELAKFVKSQRRQRTLSNIAENAECIAAAQVQFAALDADPYLLNCANGTLDLRKLEVRPHNPADLITQLSPTTLDPAAQCPKWLDALNTYACGDAAWVAYLQWLFGHTLIGEVRGELLPLLTGSGGNGKGTVLTTIARVLGDYAGALPAAALMRGTHSSAWGGLHGKRFVKTGEINTHKPLAMSTLKALTSYEGAKAQTGMGENYAEITPSWRVFAVVNGTPRITEAGRSERRRIRAVPWLAELDTRNADMTRYDQTLLSEAPGILRWLIEGSMIRHEPECAAVREATEELFDANDPIADWLDACCTVDPEKRAEPKRLHADYVMWCAANGVPARAQLGRKAFGDALAERSYRRQKSNGVRYHHGIALRAATPAVDGPGPLFAAMQPQA